MPTRNSMVSSSAFIIPTVLGLGMMLVSGCISENLDDEQKAERHDGELSTTDSSEAKPTISTHKPPTPSLRPEHQQEFQQATSFLASDPAKAHQLLVELLKKTGPDLTILNALSASYARQFQQVRTSKDEAKLCDLQVRQFANLANVYPNWSELLYRLASQRLVLQRLEPARMDELESAVIELRHLIELAQDTSNRADEASGHFQLGRTYKHQGDTFRATQRQELVPGKYGQAVEVFQKTMQLEPERIDALGEIVLIHLAQRDVASATTAVRAHLPNVKTSLLKGKMHEMLGGLHHEQGDAQRAEQEFFRAIKLNPHLVNSYLHLAASYQAAAEYDKAEDVLEQSVEQEPNFLEGRFYLGNLFLALERYSDAEEQYQALLAVPKTAAVFVGMLPSHALYRNSLYYQACSQLTSIYYRTREFDKAIAYAEQAANYQPSDAPLLETLGSVYAAQFQHEKAVELYIKAIELSNLPSSHYYLAQVYLEQDKLQSAKQHLETALASNQAFPSRSEAESLHEEVAMRLNEPPQDW